MPSLLKSTKNTRSIKEGSYRFIRSDVPEKLSDEEISWLINNNIITIIDLRENDEIKRRPSSLSVNERFFYVNFPVTGGNAVPETVADVPVSYLNMVDETMWKIIDAIENAKSNVLYFCNAGKDRTGVVSALLLKRMGAADEEIIKDYIKSADNLENMLDEYALQHPEADLEVITPKEKYMKEFLKELGR